MLLQAQCKTQPRPLLEDLLSAPELPPRRIAVVGSVDFYHQDTPALCDAIGQALARHYTHDDGSLALLTGANADIPKRLTKAYHDECRRRRQPDHAPTTPRIYHLAPSGYDCDWDFGLVVTAGRDMAERRRLLTAPDCATVVLSLEGGPGTADEMALARRAGVPVVPVARTGGASNGMFHAPSIPVPARVSTADWQLLWDPRVPVETCAQAVVRMVVRICSERQQGQMSDSMTPSSP